MNSHNNPWIHVYPDWPDFNYQAAVIQPILDELDRSVLEWRITKNSVQKLKKSFGMEHNAEILFLTESVLKSSQIEGVFLDKKEVQKSITRSIYQTSPAKISTYANSNSWDGMVAMVLDANRNCEDYLTVRRLQDWHKNMFPDNKGGEGQPLTAGQWRTHHAFVGNDSHIFYEAPPPEDVPRLMDEFIQWIEEDAYGQLLDPFVKIAIAHLRFEQIHPFADGNGRIGRAICDLMLNRLNWDLNESIEPFHSLSTRLAAEHAKYYSLFNHYAVDPSMDATEWVLWFLAALNRSVQDAIGFQNSVMDKICHLNWIQLKGVNERQYKVLYEIIRWDALADVIGNATYRERTGCSNQIAAADLRDLRNKGIVAITGAPAGRNVRYQITAWEDIESMNEEDMFEQAQADNMARSSIPSGEILNEIFHED